MEGTRTGRGAARLGGTPAHILPAPPTPARATAEQQAAIARFCKHDIALADIDATFEQRKAALAERQVDAKVCVERYMMARDAEGGQPPACVRAAGAGDDLYIRRQPKKVTRSVTAGVLADALDATRDEDVSVEHARMPVGTPYAAAVAHVLNLRIEEAVTHTSDTVSIVDRKPRGSPATLPCAPLEVGAAARAWRACLREARALADERRAARGRDEEARATVEPTVSAYLAHKASVAEAAARAHVHADADADAASVVSSVPRDAGTETVCLTLPSEPDRSLFALKRKVSVPSKAISPAYAAPVVQSVVTHSLGGGLQPVDLQPHRVTLANAITQALYAAARAGARPAKASVTLERVKRRKQSQSARGGVRASPAAAT